MILEPNTHCVFINPSYPRFHRTKVIVIEHYQENPLWYNVELHDGTIMAAQEHELMLSN